MTIINDIDNKIYSLLLKMQNINLNVIMIYISYLASAVVLIVLSISFILLLKNKKYPRYIALNLCLSYITNVILKNIIRRQRPPRLQIVSEKSFSFPSGHSMVSFAYYGFLIYLIYKNIKNKKIKYPLIIFLALLTLFIGISRVYLGVHYVTDVLGGFIFGFIYLIFFIKCIYNNKINNIK